MWPILCRRNAFDLELDPIAIFEVMDTPIEGKEKFKAVVDIPPGHFISPHDINIAFRQRQVRGCKPHYPLA